MSCEPTHAEDRPGDQGRQLAENGAITKSERASLLQVARLRARVAKDQVVAFAAKLRADFEKQLDVWRCAAHSLARLRFVLFEFQPTNVAPVWVTINQERK